MTAPLVTVAPTSALQAGDGAGLVGLERLLHLHRLEHDDDVALGDLWPSSTATLTMVPCIGLVTASPLAAAPAFLPAGALRLLRAAAGRRPSAAEPGRAATTSSRLPPTSTTTRLRARPARRPRPRRRRTASIWLSNSVSIQLRVDGERLVAVGADERRVVDDRAVERDARSACRRRRTRRARGGSAPAPGCGRGR